MAPPQAKRLSPAPSVPAATASQTPRSSDQKSGGSGRNHRYPVDAPTPGSASGATRARSQPLVTRPSESAKASTQFLVAYSSKASLSTSSVSGHSNTEEVGCVRRSLEYARILVTNSVWSMGKLRSFSPAAEIFDNCSLMEP